MRDFSVNKEAKKRKSNNKNKSGKTKPDNTFDYLNRL